MHFLFSAIVMLARLSRCSRGGRWVIVMALMVLSGSSTIVRGAYLLVAGQLSNNVVRFDIASGAASLFATYPSFSAPRELAVDDQGQIYSSISLGNRNVVKFVPQAGTDVLTAVSFTPTIGQFGPGEIQFYQGDLYVAGDRARTILQFDTETGAHIRSFSVTTSYNIRAMTIAGDDLYYAEIFQNRVRRMDLTQTPPTGGTLLTDSGLNEPVALEVGGNGNLFVTNRENPFVQEYDIPTGAFLGTFLDLTTLNPHPSQDKDVLYDPALDNYFVSDGTAVYRLSPQGTLLQTYQSSLLQEPYGIVVVVPEPHTLALLLVGLVHFAVLVRRRER